MRTDPRSQDPAIDIAPWRLSGTVYGALLNHRTALAALGDAVAQPPYRAAPRAPILYIKPRNTLARGPATVTIPAGTPELEIGASLGIIIGTPACRVTPRSAGDFIAGFLPVNDVCIPHQDFYRPSIRLRARDGFCTLGDAVTRAALGNADALGVRVRVEGQLVLQASTADMVRSVGQLLADVTDFMTLSPGDVLTLGVMAPAPRARAGQCASIEFDNLPPLVTRFEAAS